MGDNLGDVEVYFFSEIESCFNEIQYQLTRRHRFLKVNKRIETSRLLAFQKIETPKDVRIKKRDCETHITAEKSKLREP